MLSTEIFLPIMLIACLVICSLILKRLPTPHSRNLPLDGLRGILASAVFAHHFIITYHWKTTGAWVEPKSTLLNNLGAISVSLFFMITGYLFFSKIRNSEVNWTKLYFSRIKRIFPLYLFVVAIVAFITFHIKSISLETESSALKWLESWLLFRATAFYEVNSNLITAGVTWTLLYEWAFYFSLPILYVIIHRKLTKPIFIVLIFLLAIKIFIDPDSRQKLYWLFLLSFPSVIFGRKIQTITQRNSILLHLIMFILPLGILLFSKAYSYLQMVMLSILFTFIANGYNYFRLLNHNGLRKIGEISFSIYLLHGIILFVLFSWFKIYPFDKGESSYLLYFPLVYGLIIFISLITYHCIEHPFLQKQSEFKNKD